MELYAYNITITPTSPADFFQLAAEPSLDDLDPSILTSPVTDTDDLTSQRQRKNTWVIWTSQPARTKKAPSSILLQRL